MLDFVRPQSARFTIRHWVKSFGRIGSPRSCWFRQCYQIWISFNLWSSVIDDVSTSGWKPMPCPQLHDWSGFQDCATWIGMRGLVYTPAHFLFHTSSSCSDGIHLRTIRLCVRHFQCMCKFLLVETGFHRILVAELGVHVAKKRKHLRFGENRLLATVSHMGVWVSFYSSDWPRIRVSARLAMTCCHMVDRNRCDWCAWFLNTNNKRDGLIFEKTFVHRFIARFSANTFISFLLTG